ncbi:MAG: type 1 glutamine amidotransferase domain-containing protein [Thiobacillus sp.]|nr:type 1 glutamine amidotransferase domain-containing protein [Thiobacillus sp.]MDP3124453.1 type 1 glutamine amidotransferase domain-containing protein [Thiobacillus sp.]
MRALMISADHFEDSELLYPFYRLQEEGVDVYIASIARGKITGKHGYEVAVDTALRDVDPNNFDLLVLPGGKAPAKLRKDPAVIAIAQDFMRRNKPVAAICHGPQILISAGVLQGRRATCYHSVAEELQSSGALYEDTKVVLDDKLLTSRQPSDLPAFMREIVKFLGHPR